MKKEGVFQHLADQASFIDKVVLSLWGDRRARPSECVQLGSTRPIGGKERQYARSLAGICVATGNAIELRYGRLVPYDRVPPLRLALRSVAMPLTGAQVEMVSRSLIRQGFRGHVAILELTSDITRTSVSDLRQQLFTRARYVRELHDEYGRRTLYVGSPHSGWQLRVYDKTDSIVRVEFVLRLPFLQAHGIRRPEGVLDLARFELSHLVCFREFSQDRLAAALSGVEGGWRKQIVLEWPRRRPLQMLAQILRKDYKIDPTPLLQHSPVQLLLREMQRKLVW
jgi:hypothetical protein